MKKSRFSEEQIIGILKQHESGVKTAEIFAGSTGSVRRRSTKWKQKFGGMDVSEAQRLRALEDENRQRGAEGGHKKKRVELAGLRQDVAHVSVKFRLGERRACKLLGVERSSYRYEPRPDRNAALREEFGGREATLRISQAARAARTTRP
jgi:putative transposase